MQPDQNYTPSVEGTSPSVSFPTNSSPKPKGKKSGWIWVILIVLMASAIGGYFILKGSSEAEITPSPTPTPIEEIPTEEPSPEPSASPKAIDKSKIEIKVLNGTGVPGEAAFLETQLKSLGYTNIETGNASSSDATVTTVIFASSVSADVKAEITDKLEALYKEVTTKTGTVSGADIQITTGPKKGASPRPSTSASASPSASPQQ